MMTQHVKVMLGVLVGLMMVSPALADSRIEGAKMCTKVIPTLEQQYQIPSHLLASIASTESGRYHKKLKILLPWPWVINVEGKGYFYHNKAEAVRAVRQYQAQGKTSIDIGCMQVNLKHHPEAFSNIEQAFEPKHNVAYAAKYLRNLYQNAGSWKKAAAHYHSKTPSYGNKYVARVFRNWRILLDRLNLDPTAIARAGVNVKPSTITQLAKANTKRRSAPKTMANKKLPKHQSPSMKIIRVDQPRNTGIMIVRPDTQSVAPVRKEFQVASAAPKVRPVPISRSLKPQSRVIHLTPPRSATILKRGASNAYSSGPRFIFSD